MPPNQTTTRHFLLKKENFVFNDEDCLVLLMHDVTEFWQLKEEQTKVTMMKMLHSSVSHDMLQPIRNIQLFLD